MTSPSVYAAAKEISVKMKTDSGVDSAVDSFHRNLSIPSLVCDVILEQPARWLVHAGPSTFKLSDAAVSVLISSNRINPKALRL